MKQISQDIQTNTIKAFYLLFGKEDYLKHQYRDKLVKALADPEDNMNVSVFQGNGLNVQELLEIANTLPFFAQQRVIVVENSNLFKKTPDNFEKQLEELPESTHIIFVENEVDKRNRLYKWIVKKGYASEMDTPDEKMLLSWIKGLCREEGKTMDDTAIFYFVEHMGTDMLLLRNELEKLFCYKLQENAITVDDVQKVCVSQATSKMFAMLDAIGTHNQPQALLLYRDLLALKEYPIGILRMLLRHFNILMQISALSAEGKNNKEMAAACSIPPFSVKKYAAQAAKYTFEKLQGMVEMCQDTEQQIKSGNIKDIVAVELLIIRFSSTK